VAGGRGLPLALLLSGTGNRRYRFREMWGTFILDAYRWDERRELGDALEGIASARDSYGFASGGVYCFWEWSTRRVLYIGRAIDLPQRFGQHNGLAGRPTGCKLEQLEEHFASNELIGFTVMVRSPNQQTITGRAKKQLQSELGDLGDLLDDPEVGSEAELEIAHAEGLAIRSHLLGEGRLPPWNAIGGTLNDWGSSMNRPDHSAELFTGRVNHLLQARSTIRELDADPTATQFESMLLAARVRAASIAILNNERLSDFQILRAFDQLAEAPGIPRWAGFAQDRDRIRDDAYVLRTPWVIDVNPLVGDLAVRTAWTERRPIPAVPPAPRLRD